MALQKGYDQAAQRFVGDLRRRNLLEFSQHQVGIKSAMGGKFARIKSILLIFLHGEPQVLNVQLSPITLAFLIGSAHFVSSALLPFLFTGLIPGTVRPDHASCHPLGIAKPAGEKWFAVSRCPAAAFGEKRKEISELTRGQFADFAQSWFVACHLGA